MLAIHGLVQSLGAPRNVLRAATRRGAVSCGWRFERWPQGISEVKVRDVIKEMEKDGWAMDRTLATTGSTSTSTVQKPEWLRFPAIPETTCRRER